MANAPLVHPLNSVKKISVLLILLCPSFFSLASNGHLLSEKLLVFEDVTIIDSTGAPAMSNMTVVIDGNRIRAIGKRGKIGR